ncbi:MAG: hypothetical protein HQL26_02230 [Candidatus Omnitrophica bacterium]|nr:hypothetical protein [Candidatus Omnitrophota bacterium]
MDDRDLKGRFKKGSNANPKGNNQFTSIVPMIEALDKVGKQKKEDFWVMVARKAWVSDTVLVHILKKILPDRKELAYDEKDNGFNRLVRSVSEISTEELSAITEMLRNSVQKGDQNQIRD